jgi:hypothetical protein
MPKEVKRSLLLWPAVASVTISITMLNSLGTFSNTPLESAFESLKALTNRNVASVQRNEIRPAMLDSVIAPLTLDVQLTARSEYGARAMALPTRVAAVFGAESPLKAPYLNEQYELAGLPQPTNPALDEVIGGAFTELDVEPAPAEIASEPSVDQLWDNFFANGPAVVERPAESVAVAEPVVNEPAVGSIMPESTRVLAKRVFTPEPAQAELSEPSEQPAVPAREVRVATPSPVSWPATLSLSQQLDKLSTVAMRERTRSRDQLVSTNNSLAPAALWANEVSTRLSALQSLPRLGDPQASSLIESLKQLADEGEMQAERATDRTEQVEWLHAVHGLYRRVAVWQPIWEISAANESTWMVSDEPLSPSLASALAASKNDIAASGDEQGWNEYLLMDQIDIAITPGATPDRAVLAQRFLSRLEWHGLAPEHRVWLQRDSIIRLADAIRPWAHEAIDYTHLLRQIERQESDAIDLAGIDIASAVQSLRFAQSSKAVSVADAIDTYYRNANVRIAISQAMLQRLVPAIDPKTVPVRTSMMGSRVRGISRIESDLRVALKPSPNTWSIELNTVGGVTTKSTASKGPVAIRTAGKANFVATTPITVTPAGIDVGNSSVQTQGRQRLRGIETEYDGWPLVGALVRGIATNRYESMSGRSNAVTNNKIKQEVSSEVNQQLETKLGAATEQVSQLILGPLTKLSLDPQVTDLQTTDQRLLARYRLAGDWQMGAFTPRPRAPESSLMSLQIHQSALNNVLERLVPRDEPMLIRDMVKQGAETFGQEPTIPSDIPDDVSIQFAKTRPVTVEIEDGLVWITLRVMRLEKGDDVDLTQFIVRAAYKPQVNGMSACLVRDGHLRISGPRMSMRERLPVRAIFNKVLSINHPLALTLPQLADHPAVENLAISQLELREGWIAIAISEQDAPRIALIDTSNSNE